MLGMALVRSTRHKAGTRSQGTFTDKKIEGLIGLRVAGSWWGRNALPLIGWLAFKHPTRPQASDSSAEPAFRAVSRPGMNDACQ